MAIKHFVKGIFGSSKQVVNEQDFLDNAERAYLQIGKLKDKALGHADTARIAGKLQEHGELLGNKISAYNTGPKIDPKILSSMSAEEVEAMVAKKAATAKAELIKTYNIVTKTMTQATAQVGEAKSFARGQTVGKILKSKFFIIPVAIGTAAVLAGKIISGKNKRDRAELVENRNQAIAAQQAEVDAIKANTMMGLAPAPGDHAARVLAGRSGAAMGIDASNPNMTAANFEAVRA
ncbi:MAG: hypothetical protein ABL867_06855 [Rickettsiales bacterium]